MWMRSSHRKVCGTRITRRSRPSELRWERYSVVKREEFRHARGGSKGPMVVASLGAQRKEKPGRVVSARVLFVNSSTYQWHRTSRDFMRKKAKAGEVIVGLTADDKEAHPQLPIHPDLARSRVSPAVGRLTQYLTSRYATTWIMLRADDCHVEVGGAHFRPALLVFFLLCEVLGVHCLGTRRTAGQ